MFMFLFFRGASVGFRFFFGLGLGYFGRFLELLENNSFFFSVFSLFGFVFNA